MKAIVFYELAIHFNPHCAEACNNLGVIYKDRDNLDKAVECYQVIFQHLCKTSVLFLIVVSTPLFMCGVHVFTIINILNVVFVIYDHLQLALSIKPNFSQSLNNLGVVFTVQVWF